jgi:hypothetical protein
MPSKPAIAAPANSPNPAGESGPDGRRAAVNSAVEKMAKTFGTRDLVIKKVTPAADKQETDYSVYVVNGGLLLPLRW